MYRKHVEAKAPANPLCPVGPLPQQKAQVPGPGPDPRARPRPPGQSLPRVLGSLPLPVSFSLGLKVARRYAANVLSKETAACLPVLVPAVPAPGRAAGATDVSCSPSGRPDAGSFSHLRVQPPRPHGVVPPCVSAS